MAEPTRAPITGSVLAWAMEEAGHTPDSLASRLKVTPTEVRAWIEGDEHPTLSLFRELAKVLRRPSATFLLGSPPLGPSVATAFRSAPGTQLGDVLAPEEAEALRLAHRRQAAASGILRDYGSPRTDLPHVQDGEGAEKAGDRLRGWLGVDVDDQFSWSSESQALAAWRSALEAKGVLVFLLSLGEGRTRGFSVWDDHSPLVAANTTGYTAPARIFTLLHELAHLSRRHDGVCERYYFESGPKVERWCERVAAAAILPRAAVLDYVATELGLSLGEPAAVGVKEVRSVSRAFKASLAASAIRLADLRLADASLYARLGRSDRPRGGGGGGGERRAEKRVRELGHLFTSVIVEGWADGHVPLHDALDYLEVQTSDLPRVERLLSAGGAT